jgi:hypothetical protein
MVLMRTEQRPFGAAHEQLRSAFFLADVADLIPNKKSLVAMGIVAMELVAVEQREQVRSQRLPPVVVSAPVQFKRLIQPSVWVTRSRGCLGVEQPKLGVWQHPPTWRGRDRPVLLAAVLQRCRPPATTATAAAAAAAAAVRVARAAHERLERSGGGRKWVSVAELPNHHRLRVAAGFDLFRRRTRLTRHMQTIRSDQKGVTFHSALGSGLPTVPQVGDELGAAPVSGIANC